MTATKKRARAKRGSSFLKMISAEQKRLQKSRVGALARRSKIDEEIAQIDHLLSTMSSFMSGKRGATFKANGAKRAKRGSVRETILSLVKNVPEGLTRGEIIAKLNATEKAAQQSISNALSNMFKASNLKRAGRKYLAA